MAKHSVYLQFGFDIELGVLIEKIQDSGGLFLDGKTFASFPHLANEKVIVHKNGVQTTTTLDSTGATSLSITDFYENFIGLPFAAAYKSMPLQRLSRLSSSDDSRITLKRIYRAFLKVVRSVGGNINGKPIDYTQGEAVKNLNRYDGVVEHNIDSTHKIDETLDITHAGGNMLEIASITYEIDSGGVS